MNLPNKITVFRLVLVPFFVAEMLLTHSYHFSVALVIYFVACMSDTVDGSIARKRHLVTDFGKLMDPMADKVLTTCAFLCLVKLGYCNVIVVMIIMAREFLVAGMRMIAASKGVVVAANKWGKAKTFLQMAATGLTILSLAIGEGPAINYDILHTFSNVAFWVVAVVTAISGIIYVKDNAHVIESK